jgi:hypothetical protein
MVWAIAEDVTIIAVVLGYGEKSGYYWFNEPVR